MDFTGYHFISSIIILKGEVIGFRLFWATGLAFAIRPKDGVARQGRRGGFHCYYSKFSSIVYTSATPSYNDSCAVRCVTADAACPTNNVCTYITSLETLLHFRSGFEHHGVIAEGADFIYLMLKKTKREKALGVNQRPRHGYPIQQNSAACGPLVRARVCLPQDGGCGHTQATD